MKGNRDTKPQVTCGGDV